ncbi:radical SAM protein [Hahella sp. KA22]|uniref:radical SAM protein n=1 Tax=Hahella sp. KA22 TaxID=1628392 RepID=UPI000FDDC466|nr:radical SAM protein [Hahella sp. KA22]AZZ92961.1 radical SAM protein [Hahella sp. KA22]QAY56335.1 radical SAM protein [Hahella sp. KA22]
MGAIPIQYVEPVFRPPSEAGSLILQVTNGCSWNNCVFCEMYTSEQKKFKAKQEDIVLQEIIKVAQTAPHVRRVFLADGDAMVLSTRRLTQILQWLNQYFPDLQRVSSYCLPRNIKKKSVEELAELKALGLDLLYVGAESGDDLVLSKVMKGETRESTVDALLKIKQAGLRSSVMILNGLGGRRYAEQHALNSARLVNEAQPDYLSTLVVSFPLGEARLRASFDDFDMPTQQELFREVRTFLAATELNKTIFRSDHASNYLVLKGVLGKDKEKLLQQVDMAINHPEQMRLRQEWQRGL